MNCYVLRFAEIDPSRLDQVGGKAAHLVQLSRLSGLDVPDGFCVTTSAYREVVQDLSRDDLPPARLRQAIEAAPIPEQIAAEIAQCLEEGVAYAVRSSATAEDLPTASFAGQQDSFLNVCGREGVLRAVSRCWASLFSDRAVHYRNQNGFDHRSVSLAVVVQRMVPAEVSGVMFTADPVTGHRRVVSIDASFGLGEALVSGRVSPDHYKVRDGCVLERVIGAKQSGTYPSVEGGTEIRLNGTERQEARALRDAQVLELARLGRKIEAHFGSPQDIEWCLLDDTFQIVQSRPITTLFPIPVQDGGSHVYVSVGHQQMMTDAMKPLGLSVWLATAARPMETAGGRLFVDVAADLAVPARRNVIVNVLGKSDPLIRDAIMTLLDRDDFVPGEVADPAPFPHNYDTMMEYDPSIVPELIARSEATREELKRKLQGLSGPQLFLRVLDELRQIRTTLSDPRSFAVIMTSMNAAYWLNDHLLEWLGEVGAADVLSQSVPNNITSEMGLALLEVADVIRPHPAVVESLQQASDLRSLEQLEGGRQVMDALDSYLQRYGMRCAGEIDITRPRWSEEPMTLVPALLAHVVAFSSGEGKRRFEHGRQQALQKESQLLERLRDLPGGEEKARQTRRMVELLRNYAGYREYPKYDIVCRYFLCKQVLLEEAARLVEAGELREVEDLFYFRLEELGQGPPFDQTVLESRKADFRHFQKLSPPRVMTSDGEVLTGRYRREDVPAGALAGLAVSAGVVEGRARVLLSMGEAQLEPGDLLVTPYTDPSWTPLFVSVAGLVTEVGGLMTHGAVIAREYGLPAVVGVEQATRLIQDGQRIRVDGSRGWVEILAE
ncbi:phosphoenolpyruvate synthase [bacterium SCN 62-11]|nr:phosphoenolpyruvate synthase [Candidatus Eremiobacteraeota bacterium]ODT75781.1 MAG: phosphoenolpyruvate synthase [bacterium SCN 62-11]